MANKLSPWLTLLVRVFEGFTSARLVLKNVHRKCVLDCKSILMPWSCTSTCDESIAVCILSKMTTEGIWSSIWLHVFDPPLCLFFFLPITFHKSGSPFYHATDWSFYDSIASIWSFQLLNTQLLLGRSKNIINQAELYRNWTIHCHNMVQLMSSNRQCELMYK